jgi:hypothetical protein
MKRALLLLVAIALPGCKSDTSPPPITAGAGWMAQHSVGVTLATPPGELFQFAFPVYSKPPMGCSVDPACPHVNYVIRAASSLLGSAIVVRGRVETSSGPAFQYALNPNNACPGVAEVHLYMQRRGDNLTAAMAAYRWFSRATIALVGPMQFELTVALDARQWIDVNGRSGDQAAFAAARSDLQAAGLTFGGGCFAGHGVNIDKGSASFALTEFATK